jgi:hypothetical protein
MLRPVHVSACHRSILTPAEAEALIPGRCPSCEPGDESWINENLVELYRVAPVESYGAFEVSEAITWSGVGLLCIALTVPVLAWQRRRDAERYPTTMATSTSG